LAGESIVPTRVHTGGHRAKRRRFGFDVHHSDEPTACDDPVTRRVVRLPRCTADRTFSGMTLEIRPRTRPSRVRATRTAPGDSGRVVGRGGYTLVELLVVVILMGLASALVVPALLAPTEGRPPLAALVASTQQMAAERGEVLYLRVDATGKWQLQGAGALDPNLASGRVPDAGSPFTLIVSPMGSCAPDVPSAANAALRSLDALGCVLSPGIGQGR
jgi:prepilin-type N-terminal cleavage/methylation domain-containing protein